MPEQVRPASEETVFIVEDDADQRELMTQLIESINVPVRAYASGEELLADTEPTAAGCMLLDLRLRGMSGLAVQRELRGAGVCVPVVIITGFASVQIAVEAMKTGAFDFLEKPVPMHELLEVVQSALHADRQHRIELTRISSYGDRFRSLTDREQEVASRMLHGEASKVIALDLGIAEKTVEVHRSHILTKMGAAATVDFVREAVEIDGLVATTSRPRSNASRRTGRWSLGPNGDRPPSNGTGTRTSGRAAGDREPWSLHAGASRREAYTMR